MNTTGNQLRAALKYWEMAKEIAVRDFNNNQMAFEDENKDPKAAMAKVLEAHNAIAIIQTAQARYNLMVEVSLAEGKKMTLCEAVKRIGMAGQVAALWKSFLPKKDRYGSRYDSTRDKDTMVAKPTISLDEAGILSLEAQRFSNALQSAIAAANATEVELSLIGVTEDLLR